MTDPEWLEKLRQLAAQPYGCVMSRKALEVIAERDVLRMELAESQEWIRRMADRIGLAHEILARLAEKRREPK